MGLAVDVAGLSTESAQLQVFNMLMNDLKG